MSKSLPAATAFVQTKAGELRIFIQSGAVQQAVRGWFGKRGTKTGNFFEGTKYSSKVLKQMRNADDIYHAFPKSVEAYATKYGKWTTKIGADGRSYQWLEMSGSYGGKTGVFEFIKDSNGVINHRFFNVLKRN